ncbi:hypothetical protein D3C73_890620 [compost metagenome]
MDVIFYLAVDGVVCGELCVVGNLAVEKNSDRGSQLRRYLNTWNRYIYHCNLPGNIEKRAKELIDNLGERLS